MDLAWGGGDGAAWSDGDGVDIAERIAVAPDGRISMAGAEDDDDPTRILVSADGVSVMTTRLPWGLGWAYDTAWTPAGDAVTVGSREAYYHDDNENDDISVSSTLFPFGGIDGSQTDVFGSSDDVAFGVAIEADGDVVVAGVADGKPVLLRYKGQNTGDGIDLFEDGQLVVVGTDGADAIDFSVSGSTLTVRLNGTVNTFPVSLVRGIWADARGGDDTITVGAGVPGRTGGFEQFVDNGSVFLGGDGNDRLIGGAGEHMFSGGNGNDHLDGGAGSDVLTGGAGTDTADYSARTAALRVTTGDNTDGDGEAGENDKVAEDVEWVRGGSGNDYIAERGIYTRQGFNDPVRNAFWGNGGNDILDGGLGVDAHFGGAGNDAFVVENPSAPGRLDGDYYNGGGGTDTIDYSAATALSDYPGIVVTLDGVANDGRRSNNSQGGGAENDNIEPDVEVVVGTAGADRITGSAGDNRLVGNGGDDVLTGGGGRDTLEGGDGNDTLFARDGITDALLNGGAGYDKAQRDPSDPTQSIEEILA
jgi:Ca2+-binding RTX toxin-like protein